MVSIFSTQSFAQSHFNVEVGKILNGEATLTMDVNQIKSNWASAIAANSNLNLSFESITIQEKNSVFFLVGKDSRNTATSVIELILDNGNLYEARISGGSTTVTCSGCEDSTTAGECEPKKEGDGYLCTPCSKNTCKKTVVTKFEKSIVGGSGSN